MYNSRHMFVEYLALASMLEPGKFMCTSILAPACLFFLYKRGGQGGLKHACMISSSTVYALMMIGHECMVGVYNNNNNSSGYALAMWPSTSHLA
jgi:hypothetical protein